MAVKRFRKYGKKRRGGRRRVTRRIPRISNRRNLGVHFFKRYSFQQAPQTAFTCDGSGQYAGVMYAVGLYQMYTDISTLTMPSYTEFTNLFDQYKILSYTIELRPRFNGRDAAYGAGTVADIPTIYWVYDQDDLTALNMSELMQHPKVYSGRLDKPVYIKVKYPSVRSETWNSALSTGYTVKRGQWIDCNSYQLPHLGVKYIVQGTIDRDYKSLFDIRVHWRLAFKNVR